MSNQNIRWDSTLTQFFIERVNLERAYLKDKGKNAVLMHDKWQKVADSVTSKTNHPFKIDNAQKKWISIQNHFLQSHNIDPKLPIQEVLSKLKSLTEEDIQEDEKLLFNMVEKSFEEKKQKKTLTDEKQADQLTLHESAQQALDKAGNSLLEISDQGEGDVQIVEPTNQQSSSNFKEKGNISRQRKRQKVEPLNPLDEAILKALEPDDQDKRLKELQISQIQLEVLKGQQELKERELAFKLKELEYKERLEQYERRNLPPNEKD